MPTLIIPLKCKFYHNCLGLTSVNVRFCKSPIKDPVQMPCDHVCCMACANGWFEDRNACPVCRKEVGNDFKVKINRECRYSSE